MDVFYVILCVVGLLSIVVVFFESDISPFASVLLLVFVGYLYFVAISAVSGFVSAEDMLSRVLIGGVARWMLPSVILVGNVLYLRRRKLDSGGSVDDESEEKGD